MDEPLDCVVVGAGPAGLTAAIYLARFRLSIRVLDGGGSRCATIPRTRNHAGFPGGIPGRELLARMREQAGEFGVVVGDGEATALQRDEEGVFSLSWKTERLRTRAVLLATGVVNHRPRIDGADHDAAVSRGLIRYCPICDGYEAQGQDVGVIGTRGHGCEEAIFVRMYTRSVVLIAPDGGHELDEADRARLEALGVETVDGPCGRLRLEGDRIVAPTAAGDLAFQAIYPALGSRIRSELAVRLSAEASEEGCLVVDDHQRTSIPGLYAAGDVARGLDQISHAMGEAGVAAVTIRNDLARTRVLAC